MESLLYSKDKESFNGRQASIFVIRSPAPTELGEFLWYTSENIPIIPFVEEPSWETATSVFSSLQKNACRVTAKLSCIFASK